MTPAMNISGLGRNELVARLEEAMCERDSALTTLGLLTKERDAYLTNLTSVQGRCTELMTETRAQRVEMGALREVAVKALEEPWLEELRLRLEAACAKHPGGPEGIRSLAEEVGEVASAMRRETPARVRDELLDVAVVALRLWTASAREER